MSDPTNGEIAILLTGLSDKFDGFCLVNKEEHASLIEQTTRTNGRVTALENYKNMVIGGGIVVSMMVVPLFISFLSGYLKN
uniref:Uncharacterized protein n=1 Tax=viral metagenome TaxID=1070528 RepID=A0A6M3XYD1_9ZZZZ